VLLLIGPRKEPRDLLPESIYNHIASDPSITLVEPVANPELYYAIMDVFVLPSHREGFPNVVLEAAAMELPVITTDAIGCIDSVVDNKTGFIVPRKNVEKLKEKMALLLGDATMRKAMGRQARQRAIAEFSSEKVTSDLMYLIENHEFAGKPG
jgi:glycosyltransferase involved in cell wall biosynthesis